MTSLPAYIANRQRDPNALSLAQRGLQNVGSGAGPYLSIEGNHFALVDAAGNKQQIQTLFVDVCIIDLNDHLSKMYYDTDWDPNNPTPPVCFSDNGLAPSSQASVPQSLTCAQCPNNQWGSKVSKMGSEVKACRDEQKCAIIIPGMPNNIFRLTVPPNSLKNWRGYLAKFQNAGFDIQDVATRVSFQQGVNGTLEFNPAPSPWLDDATVQVRDKALAAKVSDMIVGRLDRPRQGVAGVVQDMRPGTTNQQTAHLENHLQNSQQPVHHAASGPLVQPAAAQQAAFPSTAFAPQQATPATVSPSEPQRRRRRTQAEIAAANQPPQGGAAQQAPQPQMAPFRPEASSEQANGPAGPTFGVGQGVAPNPELQSAINSIFGS